MSCSRRTASHRLFSLAPTGVYPAAHVATSAVGSYPTFSPLPLEVDLQMAVYFLWHFPSRTYVHAQALPGGLSKEPGLSSGYSSIMLL
jgi:hypothetical protein